MLAELQVQRRNLGGWVGCTRVALQWFRYRCSLCIWLTCSEQGALEDYSREQGLQVLKLVTANSDAAQFYKHIG